MRVTIDLMKKSTQIIDLSNVVNPRVGDDDLQLPLHIGYGDSLVDMRGKDVEFLSQDTNKNNIYIAGTVNTNTPGDNLFMGDLTFRFPAGTFKTDGTYDPDNTMFRIVDKETQKVISSVNVKITVMKNNIEFNFDPDKTSYDSRLETMLNDFHDKGQTMLDEIENLNNQAKSNVSGDTAATANAAKNQANQNAGDISDLKGEVASARGRFSDLPGREDAQDTAISQKETIVNANANYTALQQKDAQQDEEIASKAGKFELEDKLSQMDLNPEGFENEAALKAKYPNGKYGIMVTLDTGHRWLWVNGAWQDYGAMSNNSFAAARNASQNIMYGQDIVDWDRSAAGTFTQSADDFAKFENQHIMHTHADGLSPYVILTSPVLPIDYNVISIQFPEVTKNMTNAQGAYLELQQFAPQDDPSNDTTGWGKKKSFYVFGDPNITLCKFSNIKLNDDTNRIRLRFVLHNTSGDMYVGTPVVNYGDVCIPYSPLTEEKNREKALSYLAKNSLDLLYGQGLSDMDLSDPAKATITNTNRDALPGVDLIDFVNNDNGLNEYKTPFLAVTPSSTVSFQVPGRVVSGKASVAIRQSKDRWGTVIVSQTFLSQTNQLSLNKFENIKLDPSTNFIAINVSLNGQGELLFGMPKVNYGIHCIPYNQFDIPSDNLLENSGVKFDTSMGIYNLVAEDSSVVSFDTVNHHNPSPILNFSRIPLSDTEISLQVPYQSTGVVWAQLRYSTDMNDNPQTNLLYSLPASKDKRFAKFEGIELPAGTKSVQLRIWPNDGTQGTIWEPKLNYGTSCMPYEKYSHLDADLDVDSQAQSIAHLYIAGGPQDYNKIVPFKYVGNSANASGYINYDIQGNSSRNYEKKNFKIKLFNDLEGKEKLNVKILQSWKKNDKYNLKANWIDATQSRNIVNARLFKDAVAITPLANPDQVAILDTPDFGQMNGIPVEVYFNNEFYGLYTFNTKKDDVTFAMDAKNEQHEVVSVNISQNAFSDANATVDGTNYSTEIHDKVSDTINSNFTKLMSFVNTSTDEDFKSHIGDYIDVKSVINEILFGTFSHEYDFYAKSILLATWNGGSYWYMIPYDLDSTWGLDWNGADIKPLDDDYFNLSLALKDDSKAGAIGKFENGNKLLSRIYQLFKPEIKTQGQELRSSVWSTQAIINKFRNFIDDCPADSYKREQEKWTTLPSANITSFNQIQSYVIKRGQDFDAFLAQLA